MQQMIEGLDNEVALLLFFTTAVIAVVFPLYIVKLFRPTTERTSEERPQGNQENQPDSIVDAQFHYSTQENSVNNATVDYTSETTSTDPPSVDLREPTEDSTSDSFVIKVKLQEETQEQTVTQSLKLKQLKQRCFPEQHGQGKLIRFIHAGKLLTGEESTLQQLGIVRPCVLQCVITEQINGTSGTSEASPNLENDILDLSSVLYICYGALIVCSWSLLLIYDDWFSTFGMLVLSVLTVFAFFLVF